ncbi:MAG: uracil-DNA glycosylase [Magnetococcales bacterium]|nr:uracil-DNA glycosylase [Magnetococcales bacterium]
MTAPAMEMKSALLATLRYWRECGIDRLSGEEFGWVAGRALPTFSGSSSSLASRNASRPIPPPPVGPVEPPVVAPEQRPVARKSDRLLTSPVPVPERAEMLRKWSQQILECKQCGLSLTRQRAVGGQGSGGAPVVWIGDAPSEADESRGEPFSGELRAMVTGMVRALGLSWGEVYFSQVIRCRPPGDRTPRSAELQMCQEYWIRELETIRPRAILALGKVAVETLLGPVEQLAKARKQVHSWRGVPVIAAYHPAYCLRAPLAKRAMWEDLLLMKTILEKASGADS